MRTIRIKLYKFAELSEEAKKKALQNLSDINVDHNWWEYIYDDAAEAGLKMTGFDEAYYCTGFFIESAEASAHKIIDNHGEDCETYKTAQSYLKKRDETIDTAPKDANGDFEDEGQLDDILDLFDRRFLRALFECYRILLRNAYDYLTSCESIIETIESNEYEFTADGKLY